uniref:Serine/threonine-protein phosphatase 4 regulatory subunit 4 n=2 Tax=Lygus hesperus TaxID=30085 RepID=A0A0K8SYZ9_LYGHE
MHQRERSDVTVSRCVLAVLKEKVIPVPQFVENFLPTVIKYLDHDDEAVVAMWSTTLIEAIPLLPVDVLQEHVAPVAIQRSQPTRPVNQRINSCSVLGELALQYEPPLLKKDLLPVCLSLCQDESLEVRSAICTQLEKVIKQLKGDSFKTTLGPSLVELGSDEAIRVKEAAFVSAVNILGVVETDDVVTTLIPLLKRIIQYGFTSDDNILLPIASRYGEMCLGIKDITDEKQTFVKYFISIASVGLPQSWKKGCVMSDSDYQIKFPSMLADQAVLCRQAAAANLPAIFSFCEGDNESINGLLPVLDSLCSDPSAMVRKTISAGFSQIATFLGSNNPSIRINFIKILNDDAEEVLDGLIPQLNMLISMLTQNEFFNPKMEISLISELNPALLKCEGLVSTSHNWRLYCTFLSQIRILADILAPEALHADYTRLLLSRIHQTRTVPIRSALIDTILFFLRRTPIPEHRMKVIETIIQDFCRSTNFYNRIFYLRSCHSLLSMFSMAFFKKYFFSPTLLMIDDAVPNIRWALMMLLPKLNYLAEHPPDEDLKKQLEAVRIKLNSDKDREIARVMGSDVGISQEEDLKCFEGDQEKFEEETKLGEYETLESQSTKQVTGSRIPRSPSANSSLVSANKAVLRRKPSEHASSKTMEDGSQKEVAKEKNNSVPTENVNKLAGKTFKRAIPISRTSKSRSAPSSRQGSFKDKRMSLDEIDMNKNIETSASMDLLKNLRSYLVLSHVSTSLLGPPLAGRSQTQANYLLVGAVR